LLFILERAIFSYFEFSARDELSGGGVGNPMRLPALVLFRLARTVLVSFTLVLLISSPSVAAPITTLQSPTNSALEAGGITALLTDGDRLLRVNLADFSVSAIIATGLAPAQNVAIESGGATALVLAKDNSLVRVKLSDGTQTTVTSSLMLPAGLAIEAGGASVLVTDCGSYSSCLSGRLVRVTLATGTITAITPVSLGLAFPAGIAIEAGGTTALVAVQSQPYQSPNYDQGTVGKLLRVQLASGGATTLALPFVPYSIAIESGGATALVGSSSNLSRVNLATGATTGLLANSGGGVVLESPTEAILVDSITPRMYRVALSSAISTIAPSLNSSAAILGGTQGLIGVRSDDAIFLVDSGTSGSTGSLLQANAATGNVTVVAGGFASQGGQYFFGTTLNPTGTAALVLEPTTEQITSINLASGAETAGAVINDYPRYLAWLNATTVAVSGGNAFWELNPTTNVAAPVSLTLPAGSSWVGPTSAMPGGQTALISYANTTTGVPSGVGNLNLTTNVVTPIAAGLGYSYDIRAEASGKTAIIAADNFRVLRLNLATGQYTHLARVNSCKSAAIEPSGTTAIVEGVEDNYLGGQVLVRAGLSTPAINDHSLAYGLNGPGPLVMEAGGATALFLDCTSNQQCTSSGRLARLNLTTGAVTTLASGLNFSSSQATYSYSGLAVEASGATALVADCGAAGTSTCGSTGRLLRINLSTGATTVLASGLSAPTNIAIESGGATALLLESGPGNLTRVALSGGSFNIIASGLNQPAQIVVESGGSTALVSTYPGIVRVDLTAKTVTTVSNWPGIGPFAIEAGGETLLASEMALWSNGGASLVRIYLDSGQANVVVPNFLDMPGSLVLQGNGQALVTEPHGAGIGAIMQLTIPPEPAMVSLSATSVAFGTEPVNTESAYQPVTLTNTGAVPVTISGVALTGSDPTQFLISANYCPTSLAAGANCSIHLHFYPNVTGPASAALTITDNAAGSPQSIMLTGTSVSSAPTVSLSTASLAFGNVTVQTESVYQGITLTNTGGAPLTIGSIALTGTNKAQFVISANYCPASLAAAASCAIHLHFYPQVAGAALAALTITDNATGSPQSVSLTGTGIAPAAASLSTSSLAFGGVLVKTESVYQGVTLTNTGGLPLTIGSVALTGTNMSQFLISANYCPASLAAGASCAIHLHFDPQVTGAATAALTITDNAIGSPQSVTLTGTGIAPAAVTLSTTSIAFGSQTVTTESAYRPVTLTNSGGSPLTISSIALTGTNPTQFLISTNSCSASLAAGANCVVNLHFYPEVTGAVTAALTITDNATGSPQIVMLTGTGIAVTARTLTITSASLPKATAGSAYSFTLAAAGGTPPYTWTADIWSPDVASALPGTNGMTISHSGVLSGTPIYSGTMPVLFQLSDSASAEATVQLEFSVGGTGSLGTLSGTPPGGAEGQAYSYSNLINLAGTECGASMRVIEGVIPPGLTLGTNIGLTTNSYTLTGTPTIAGSFTFTLSSWGFNCTPAATNAQTFTIQIAPATSSTSPAGSSNWVRQSTSPVLVPGASSQWDSFAIRSPSVLKVASTYVMFYEGEDIATHTRQIGRAVSPDGVTWTKSPSTPVLAPGASGAWDSLEVRYPTVTFDGTTYRMWYWGANSSCHLIGLATSSDGITWKRNATAVTLGSCGFGQNFAPGAVVENAGTFTMWYWVPLGGSDPGMATSTDGVNWTDHGFGSLPIDWPDSSYGVARPSVVLDGNTYRMWYSKVYGFVLTGVAAGGDVYKANVGYATSSDGLNWTVYPGTGGTVFVPGVAAAWDRPGVGDASVIEDGTTFKMWYTGGRINLPLPFEDPPGYGYTEGSIGYALIP
jgi:predicted GH43/DUF377 family glycosyl hydrolase/sugar lactone lactonase YvrE